MLYVPCSFTEVPHWLKLPISNGPTLRGTLYAGCTKISPGCDNCYAETFAERFRGVPGHPYEQGFDLRLRPEAGRAAAVAKAAQ